MASHNDITGDKIQTKGVFSKEAEDRFDAIFGKKEPKRIYTNEEIKSWHWVNDLEMSEDEAQIMARDMGVEDE